MTFSEWTIDDARDLIAVPVAASDKYSRGVLGVVTGSNDYPGAAVLGVEAALHTGVGMLRYLGPDRPTSLVLQRRPEVVTRAGRVQAWLLGSGMDADSRNDATSLRLAEAIWQGLPTVIDAGALDLLGTKNGPLVITPHYGELARVLSTRHTRVDRREVAQDPEGFAVRAADALGVTVLLKGARTFIADAAGSRLFVDSTNPWTATAGAGDALGGILGALLATHTDEIAADETTLARLAATASTLHFLAASAAGDGGPFPILDLATGVASVVRRLVRSP